MCCDLLHFEKVESWLYFKASHHFICQYKLSSCEAFRNQFVEFDLFAKLSGIPCISFVSIVPFVSFVSFVPIYLIRLIRLIRPIRRIRLIRLMHPLRLIRRICLIRITLYFIFHLSSFILHLSYFIFHLSSFIFHLSSFGVCCDLLHFWRKKKES